MEEEKPLIAICCICDKLKIEGEFIDLSKAPYERSLYDQYFTYTHTYCPECYEKELIKYDL